MRNVMCALIHSQLNEVISWWLIPIQITQGSFCLSVHAAAQLLFWENSCEERKEVKYEQNVAWLLKQDWS